MQLTPTNVRDEINRLWMAHEQLEAHVVGDRAFMERAIGEKYLISSWEGDTVKAAPIYPLMEIESKSAIDEGVRLEQAYRNCRVVDKRVSKAARHDGRDVIVGTGPSLKETWHGIAVERKAFGATVISTSGAHDFLIERGIVPDIHIEVDPREYKAFHTRNPHPDVKYWIASSCHPTMIDQLKDFDLSLFHTFNDQGELALIAADGPDPGGLMVCGGGTAGCRAINLRFCTGTRWFSCYGMDCSFEGDKRHAVEHNGKEQPRMMVRAGDRWFGSSPAMMATARGFLGNLALLHRVAEANDEPYIENTGQRVELILHGDGLLQHMARLQGEGETGLI